MTSSAGTDDMPAMVQFHARRVQKAWESVVELFKGNDYMFMVQAVVMLVSGYVYLRMPQVAILYIQKGCDLIQAGNLQFVPTYGRPPEFSEGLHETLAALSQVIYWTNFLFLMHGGPEPYATAELEKEFRCELLVGKITAIFLYIELTFHCSELIRFSSRSVLWRCGRKVSCSSGMRFCSSVSSLPTVSVVLLPQLVPARV